MASLTHSTIPPTKPQKIQFKYEGLNEKLFYKKVIRMLYDADIDDIVFRNGDTTDLTSSNIWVKCI